MCSGINILIEWYPVVGGIVVKKGENHPASGISDCQEDHHRQLLPSVFGEK